MATVLKADEFRGRATTFGSRALELTVGLTANAAVVWGFDYLLYPLVIYHYGVLLGGLVMTLVSFLVCLASFKFYDWSKRDWLGIEAIKSLKSGGASGWARFAAWMLNKSEPVAAVFLSIKFDPFITTLYLRKGAYDGLSARDWRIFLFSLILGNAYWIAATFMGLTLAAIQ